MIDDAEDTKQPLTELNEEQLVDRYLSLTELGLNTLQFIDYTLLYVQVYGDKWIKAHLDKVLKL